MNKEDKEFTEHFVAEFSKEVSFDELPDAPPSGKFKLSITGRIGAVVVAFWIFIAIFGQFLAPYHENDIPFPDDYMEFQPPKAGALLGTDRDDRDVLSRVMYGASRTIGISFAATVLAYIVGVTLGIGSAVLGGKSDMVISRINDIFLSLPTIMLGLVIVAAVGSTIPILILTGGLIYATVVFRLARSIGMDVKVMDYVEVSKGRGENLWWIISKEIWPNVRMPLISDFGLRLIYVILFVSSLSFLGLGVQPPMADWGSMVKENLGALQYGESVLSVVMPAFSIATLTVAINLIVDDVSAHAGGKLTKRL